MNDVIAYYQKISDTEICLLKVFSKNAVVYIPKKIDGFIVRQIGNYCFSKKSIDLSSACLSSGHIADYVECSKENVSEIIFPKTLTKIGSYAFYQCRKLERIVLPTSLQDLGSDAFMNCMHLHVLGFKGSIYDSSILKQILNQITWDIEVQFQEASIFYPEYDGGYDEVGPAHIFALNIQGEGFRMRQCFKDGKIQFDEYDACFEKVCVEENETTIFHMACCRMFLNPNLYVSYIQKHASAFMEYIHKYISKKTEIVKILLDYKGMNQSNLDWLIQKEKNIEEKTMLMSLKQNYFYSSSSYSFEDFS